MIFLFSKSLAGDVSVADHELMTETKMTHRWWCRAASLSMAEKVTGMNDVLMAQYFCKKCKKSGKLPETETLVLSLWTRCYFWSQIVRDILGVSFLFPRQLCEFLTGWDTKKTVTIDKEKSRELERGRTAEDQEKDECVKESTRDELRRNTLSAVGLVSHHIILHSRLLHQEASCLSRCLHFNLFHILSDSSE